MKANTWRLATILRRWNASVHFWPSSELTWRTHLLFTATTQLQELGRKNSAHADGETHRDSLPFFSWVYGIRHCRVSTSFLFEQCGPYDQAPDRSEFLHIPQINWSCRPFHKGFEATGAVMVWRTEWHRGLVHCAPQGLSAMWYPCNYARCGHYAWYYSDLRTISVDTFLNAVVLKLYLSDQLIDPEHKHHGINVFF